MDIVQKVFEAGVVGAGGAGFPTHIKLSSKVDTVIANGVECEPLLWSDKVIMKCFAQDVLKGMALAMEATGAKSGLIAVKEYAVLQKRALEETILKERLNIRVVSIPDFYPSGDEHVLVNYLTSRIIPEKGIPTAEKILVNNINTLRNVYLAGLGEPVTRVAVTLGGEVVNPGVYFVPVGTSIADFLRLTGNSLDENRSVIEGGPLTGRLVRDISRTISKVSTGILVLPDYIPAVSSKMAVCRRSYNIGVICNQCRRCTDYCPRYLLGHEIYPNEAMKYINFGIESEEAVKSAMLCCSCGVCDAFACDMGLSPRKYLSELLKNSPEKIKENIRFYRPAKPREYSGDRRLPAGKLMKRLGIVKYAKPLEYIDKSIEPERVSLNLQQGFGNASKPLVKTGDNVKRGFIIAQAQGKIGSNLHSSVNGIVESADENVISIKVKCDL